MPIPPAIRKQLDLMAAYEAVPSVDQMTDLIIEQLELALGRYILPTENVADLLREIKHRQK